MNDASAANPGSQNQPPPVSQYAALKRLYLTLFLRGHAAQGVRRETSPRSIAEKLALHLLLYALFGMSSFALIQLPAFVLAAYLHGTSFFILAMFMSSSVGAILFNRDESDILLHRPIDTRLLLRAKIVVVIEASLCIAVALNFVGLVGVLFVRDGGWRFVIAHIISLGLESLFTAGLVVTSYQLCLRWCGRERLEAVMTSSQVLLSMLLVAASQILPRVTMSNSSVITGALQSWWAMLMPPAWFAGLDLLASGTIETIPVLLASLAIAATTFTSWLAFTKLARDYQSGLQKIGEAIAVEPKRSGSKLLFDRAMNLAPVRWWLRDPVERASFQLIAAYLIRDRDLKLRVYPSLAPMIIMPLISMFQGGPHRNSPDETIGLLIGAGFLNILPILAISQLEVSQQWQAADVFRSAPLCGPGPLNHGLRRAVLVFFACPALILMAACCWFATWKISSFALLLPVAIAMPMFAILACSMSRHPPLSRPVEDAKASGQIISIFGIMILSFGISVTAWLAWSSGFFLVFLVAELAMAITVHTVLYRKISKSQWIVLD